MDNNIVYLFNKEATTDTLKVAELFGKAHKTVLRNADRILKHSPLAEHSFVPSKYKDKSGKWNKYYRLNRDGFLLLLMSLRGQKVMNKQEQFISLFNKLEVIATEVQTPEYITYKKHLKMVRLSFTDVVKEFVQYAISNGSKSADRYYIILTKDINKALFNVTSINRSILTYEESQKLELAEMTVSRIIKDEMMKNTYYKDCRKVAISKLKSLFEPTHLELLRNMKKEAA